MTLKQRKIFITVLFAISFCLGTYPFISSTWNNYRASLLITDYVDTSTALSDLEYEIEYSRAMAYNRKLSGTSSVLDGSLVDSTDYESVLNYFSDGIMAYISIPKIDVYLPIYHYDTDEVLEKGIGHIETTSVPVGGESTHCVLTGHRGIPGSRLFTDLDQMEIGDTFYICVLGHTLAYEVTQIQTVLPTQVDSLNIVSGEDLVTLVTCTPYGVNTHRLLVTGSRIENITDEEAEQAMEEESAAAQSYFTLEYILLYASLAEILVYLILMHSMKKENDSEEDGIIEDDEEYDLEDDEENSEEYDDENFWIESDDFDDWLQ